MTAADSAERISDDNLALLHDDVRAGRACIATFEGPGGSCWVELLGPRGIHPQGDWLVAPVPTLRLWVPEHLDRPQAVAVANRDFDDGLRAIEEQARPHLFPPEVALLGTVLRIVREAARGVRPRVPTVGGRLTQEGAPMLRAWASCLTLGDLETALQKAVA